MRPVGAREHGGGRVASARCVPALCETDPWVDADERVDGPRIRMWLSEAS